MIFGRSISGVRFPGSDSDLRYGVWGSGFGLLEFWFEGKLRFFQFRA